MTSLNETPTQAPHQEPASDTIEAELARLIEASTSASLEGDLIAAQGLHKQIQELRHPDAAPEAAQRVTRIPAGRERINRNTHQYGGLRRLTVTSGLGRADGGTPVGHKSPVQR